MSSSFGAVFSNMVPLVSWPVFGLRRCHVASDRRQPGLRRPSDHFSAVGASLAHLIASQVATSNRLGPSA